MEDTLENRLKILQAYGYDKFQKRDYVSSIVYYQKYLELDQTNPDVYNMLGYLYRVASNKYKNLEKQIQYFEKAIQLKPDFIEALRNLAITYPLVGRYDDAINCFHKLFELGPVTDDYITYAYLKIRLGDFKEGWKYYEYRFIKEYMPSEYPKIDKPRWEGNKIPNKVLLVQYEQGFGDTIQFCRYLERVKPLVKKIIFRVQNELVDLMKSSLTDIDVVGMSTSLDELNFDYHVPLISLLYIMKETKDNIPLTQGYIKADKNKIEQYKKEYFNNDCLKIGISWHGMKLGNRLRNIPLEYFYPLTNIKNTKVYSFQKGCGNKELNEIPQDIEIIDLGKTFNDFSDTAAAMANLDLFITSDNGVFNLAGAMGIKTYLLLNHFAEWRWFLDDKTTPWYENVEIFRKQDEYDKWDLLINQVIEKISQTSC